MRFPTIPRRTNSAVQEQILGLAKSNLPIAKLARMFCREYDTVIENQTQYCVWYCAEQFTFLSFDVSAGDALEYIVVSAEQYDTRGSTVCTGIKPSTVDPESTQLLLTSLDVREGSKSINPNFESILGMLSQLEEILDEAKECIESATLDIIPLDTHDLTPTIQKL
ncbi:hypothetical protein H4Q26_002619 [Puccinia striiformis f. sp. tritici PST-130]|nr:hypothetical protein H4Q26_002619 [Puccinia striiformis f. sp. tritici PST-130]